MIDNKHELDKYEKQQISSFKEDWGEFLRNGKGEDYANIEDAILFSNNMKNSEKGFFSLIYRNFHIYLFTTTKFCINLRHMPSNSIYSLEEIHAYTIESQGDITTAIKLTFVPDW